MASDAFEAYLHLLLAVKIGEEVDIRYTRAEHEDLVTVNWCYAHRRIAPLLDTSKDSFGKVGLKHRAPFPGFMDSDLISLGTHRLLGISAAAQLSDSDVQGHNTRKSPGKAY